MRRFLALARTAAVESLAEPLAAVLFLSGMATVHLAPVFHYHQFGEAGRLARECGFSVVLVFGLIFATAAAQHALGRELARGTASVALALAVPRSLFFIAKTTGVLAALALFAAAAASATCLSQGSCAIAGLIQAEEGTGPQTLGLALSLGVGLTLGAIIFAAAAHRWAHRRFCLNACLAIALAEPLALVLTMGFVRRVPAGFEGFAAIAIRLAPAFATLGVGCAVFVVLAAALAVRLPGPSATALTALAIVAAFVSPVRPILPVFNHFWLVDRLAAGGTLGWCEVAPVLAAGALLMAFWFIVGAVLLSRREIP